jgi:hypothetical protein
MQKFEITEDRSFKIFKNFCRFSFVFGKFFLVRVDKMGPSIMCEQREVVIQ